MSAYRPFNVAVRPKRPFGRLTHNAYRFFNFHSAADIGKIFFGRDLEGRDVAAKVCAPRIVVVYNYHYQVLERASVLRHFMRPNETFSYKRTPALRFGRLPAS